MLPSAQCLCLTTEQLYCLRQQVAGLNAPDTVAAASCPLPSASAWQLSSCLSPWSALTATPAAAAASAAAAAAVDNAVGGGAGCAAA